MGGACRPSLRPFPPCRPIAGVSTARKLAGLLILPVVLYLLYLVQTRQIEYFEVTGGSMEPTVKVGERWLMRARPTYGRGDIVVLSAPGAPSTMLVKRLVAVWPDRVTLREGKLYINDQRAAAPGANPEEPDEDAIPDQTWSLEPGQGFVIGDNRRQSDDSRAFGPIRIETIRGVLFKRVE